jgi:hypothetical protein
MALFAISIKPFLCMLEEKLIHTRPGNRTHALVIITYADDVTIILRTCKEITYVKKALQIYEAASGAHLNVHKSKAVALGAWDTSVEMMEIPYSRELNILGTRTTITIRQSAQLSWNVVTGSIKMQAKDAYYRAPTFDKRIEYMHMCLLARVWYIAQIFPHLKTTSTK